MDERGCWICGSSLIWNNDYDPDGVLGTEGLEGQITHLRCSSCKAFVEYRLIIRDGEVIE